MINSNFKSEFIKRLVKESFTEEERKALIDNDFGDSSLDKFDNSADLELIRSINNKENQKTAVILKHWIDRFTAMKELINDESDSILSFLQKNEPDSIFGKIYLSEKKKLDRLAQELATISESFRSYLIEVTSSYEAVNVKKINKAKSGE